MNDYFIAPIVEGHGEQAAVPKLLRRIFQEVRPDGRLVVNPPFRVPVGKFLQNEFEMKRCVELCARKGQGYAHRAILILFDCEDRCPAELGPEILQKALKIRSDIPIVVALAYREYETWFLSAAKSLRGIAGLPPDLESPVEPEAIRGAKEWLDARMAGGYDPVGYQAVLTQSFSLDEAEACSSFARLRLKLKTLFS